MSNWERVMWVISSVPELSYKSRSVLCIFSRLNCNEDCGSLVSQTESGGTDGEVGQGLDQLWFFDIPDTSMLAVCC